MVDLTPESRAGFLVGAIAAAALVAFVLLVQPRPRVSPRGHLPLPVAGLAIAAATLVALSGRRDVPGELLIAVAGISAVCAVPAAHLAASLATALTLPFAIVLASSFDGFPRWLEILLVIAASVGPVAAARTDGLWRSLGITPALLLLTVAALFFAVPDTEEVGVLLGCSLPVALLGWPLRFVSLGSSGAGAVTVIVVWTAATGGRSDHSAIVGALGCLALLVGLSIGHRLSQTVTVPPAVPDPPRLPLVLLTCQAVLAFVAARVGAVRSGVDRAAVVTIVVMLLSVFAGARSSPSVEDDDGRHPRP